MKTFHDCPFPAAWSADELIGAVPRPLSSLFANGIPADTGALRPTSLTRIRRRPFDRGLPTLFRVR